MKCTLDAELNNCPHFVKDTGKCLKADYCCFREPDVEVFRTRERKREPKWFDKYYK